MFCKCKLCGRELSSKRAAHGHLITSHTEAYRKAGFNQAQFMEYTEDKDRVAGGAPTPGAAAQHFSNSNTPKPRGLRHLNYNISIENTAAQEVDPEYNETYEYIDFDGNCYTEAEIIKRGWI